LGEKKEKFGERKAQSFEPLLEKGGFCGLVDWRGQLNIEQSIPRRFSKRKNATLPKKYGTKRQSQRRNPRGVFRKRPSFVWKKKKRPKEREPGRDGGMIQEKGVCSKMGGHRHYL